MSGLLNECQTLFHTSNLYDVLGLTNTCKQIELRKAFYKCSLLYHPDRHKDSDKLEATKRFQILSRVYSYLTDQEKRKIYDETGLVEEGDQFINNNYDDWVKYWELLFPRITTVQIDEYNKKYKGSEEEINDLIEIYNRCEGDMDVIIETLLFSSYQEETRIRNIINKLIDDGKLEAYDSYINEKPIKAAKRAKRAKRENNLFAKQRAKSCKNKDSLASDNNLSSLATAIQARHEQSLKSSENLLDKLSKKYCKQPLLNRRSSKLSK